MKHNDSIEHLIRQFRRAVEVYSKATGISREEAIEILMPGVMKALETRIRERLK